MNQPPRAVIKFLPLRRGCSCGWPAVQSCLFDGAALSVTLGSSLVTPRRNLAPPETADNWVKIEESPDSWALGIYRLISREEFTNTKLNTELCSLQLYFCFGAPRLRLSDVTSRDAAPTSANTWTRNSQCCLAHRHTVLSATTAGDAARGCNHHHNYTLPRCAQSVRCAQPTSTTRTLSLGRRRLLPSWSSCRLGRRHANTLYLQTSSIRLAQSPTTTQVSRLSLRGLARDHSR